jgi:hypothetical protein
VPIFNLLYEEQKVKINVNGRMLEGYEIKNGVKQGDSLSCILFIMCMDPLIRNIEMNNDISRAEIRDTPLPKVVAYADDITCIVERDGNSMAGIFKEYGRLSRASGLSLNADKTEILDIYENQHRVRYEGQEHCLRGVKSVKINGVIFNKDIRLMKEENLAVLIAKIESMLRGWRARQLSLLGKILIYKTFGMSQVIYVLSIISLDVKQYKKLDTIFNNFIWGRELMGTSTGARIGKIRFNTPIEYGGFGMIQYERILDGVYCRQLSKMYNAEFNHPIKSLIIRNDTHFATGNSLTNLADGVAIKAHNRMNDLILKNIKKSTNQEIITDQILCNQFGAREIADIIKPRWVHSIEATRLIHTLGCNSIKDIIDCGRMAIKLGKKIIKAPFMRIIKIFWQMNIRCEEIYEEKFKILNGRYKNIYMVSSKEFRELLDGHHSLISPKLPIGINIEDEVDRHTVKNYFNTVRRLVNTRHKNTLLRIWNGDCLSYTRLVHMQIVDSNLCPNCMRIDTPLHTLVECHVADQVWSRLMTRIPKSPHIQLVDYVLGLFDGKIELSIKAEVLKMLMHFRSMDAEAIHRRLKNYFLTINPRNAQIRQIFGW